ncbi:MAG: site-specific DNA-methyltransferase [Bdellovibrionales bacterium]
MAKKQKLELNWIGKDNRPKLEPRILLEDATKSYHAKHKVTDSDLFDNQLIFGDNLLALKALEQDFSGKIKCVFIDPPYNTGSAFEHYDDGVEHSIWLSLMRDRLELLYRLLRDDGSIWITIDDNEAHYLKVLCDEIFGRNNFLASCIWHHSVQGKGYSGKFSVHHNYVLVYRKSDKFSLQDLRRTEDHNVNYSNPDNDPKGRWRSGDVRNSLVRRNLMYDITTPSGKIINHPPKGWRFSKETFEEELAEGKIMFSPDETRIIRKIYLCDQEGRVPETLWFAQDVGTTREANTEIKNFVEGDYFDTPKPERLIQRILELSTAKNDLVLDSFAGSGTTGAVAHKMGRRWIMVELGQHCYTHIIPRLKKVVDGDDNGGVTEATGWKGGGGFRYYYIAPSLLQKDKWGNWVISTEYNATMLSEAMCKLMGFTYGPHPEHYWIQGHSSETDFIYVTTSVLTHDQLKVISEEVGKNRTLLICCKAFKANQDAFENLTIRKIPAAVLVKCEWGKDDYSLNVASLQPKPEPENKGNGTPSLFDKIQEG